MVFFYTTLCLSSTDTIHTTFIDCKGYWRNKNITGYPNEEKREKNCFFKGDKGKNDLLICVFISVFIPSWKRVLSQKQKTG